MGYQSSTFSSRLLSIMRIAGSLLFMAHGSQKLFGFPAAMPMQIDLFSLIGVAGILEFFGGFLLLIGLWVGPTAGVLAVEMIVAYFKAHAGKGFWPLVNGGEMALLYCSMFLFIAVAGGGVWSLDELLRRRKDQNFRDQDSPS